MNRITSSESVKKPVSRARTLESKAKRRNEILNIALEAFFQKGFKATRMDDIAAGAGITKGALYLYFNSKESLFIGLIEDMAKPKLDQLMLLLQSSDSSAKILQKVINAFCGFLNDQQMPKLMKVLIADSGSFPNMVVLYRESLIEKGLGLIAKILHQGKERGEFYIDDCHEIAKLVIAPIIFSAIWKSVFEPTDNKKLDVSKLLNSHIAIFINGISSKQELLP